MSEARPYKKPEREKALERDNAELEKELVADKDTEKTIIREEVVSPPKTEHETKKKEEDKDKEKETLDDVSKEDRYKASPGP